MAVAVVLALANVVSPSMGGLSAELQRHDVELVAMSERASRMQELMHNIHKVNLPAAPEIADLPFVGFAGLASQVQAGRTVNLGQVGKMEIVHAERVRSPLKLSSAAAGQVEMMVLTVRVSEQPDAPTLQVVVAVTPQKRLLSAEEQRSL